MSSHPHLPLCKYCIKLGVIRKLRCPCFQDFWPPFPSKKIYGQKFFEKCSFLPFKTAICSKKFSYQKINSTLIFCLFFLENLTKFFNSPSFWANFCIFFKFLKIFLSINNIITFLAWPSPSPMLSFGWPPHPLSTLTDFSDCQLARINSMGRGRNSMEGLHLFEKNLIYPS